jgi:predicted GTPase
MLKKLRKWLQETPSEVPAQLAMAGMTAEHVGGLAHALEAEESKPPCIALIGETGVGKTSTINALFGKGLDVSHARACTQIETEIMGERGQPVRVFDMPGLGEDLDADERHFETYRRVLPDVDAVVWILKADNRAMTNVQRSLGRLVKEDILDPGKLVIALNQVDLVQPGDWDRQINLPSPEQELTIAKRREDVLEKTRKVVTLPERHVVAYSARTFFNLDALLEALLDACDETRRWVLHDRARCADFNSLVDLSLASAEAE